MTLGDLNKDAVAVAQAITAEERGVAVCTGPDGGLEPRPLPPHPH